jgi:transposase
VNLIAVEIYPMSRCLTRGGNRDANRALYLLAIGRLGWDDRTRTYADKRTRQGKTKSEIIRCLKRYLARELYPSLLELVA